MGPNTTTSISQFNGTIPSLEDIEIEQLDIPSIVFLVVLLVFGTIGNIHTILVYTLSPELKKLPVRMLIICLSATDLIVCAVCMPFEIVDVRYDFTFRSDTACKIFRYLLHTTAISSGLFLVTIAIQRFKISSRKYFPKNDKPEKIFNVATIFNIVFSLLINIPALLCYGVVIKETPYPGLTGTDCALQYKYQNDITYSVFVVVVSVMSTIGFIVAVVLYSKILYLICAQKQNNAAIHLTELSDQTGDITMVAQAEEKTRMQIRFANSRQLTISLIAATAVSYTGYLVHVLSTLVVLTNPSLMEKNEGLPGDNILSKMYFINNAANPILYCLLDRKFRKECIDLYQKFGRKISRSYSEYQ